MTQNTLPWLTVDCPGIGGVLKQVPEDFQVEEIPAYQPSGDGEHLFLWIEKNDVSAEQLTRHLARVLNLDKSEIGVAGLKDRRAVTRQYVSVPAKCEPLVDAIESENIRVLQAKRHGNKLKTAHLKGNRFSLLVREVSPEAETQAAAICERILPLGFLNYFGDQRFGHQGSTLETGLALLRGEMTERDLPKSRRRFLRRLSLSAVQSELFNMVLANRVRENLIDQVLPGDVMQVTASGGVFVVEDLPTEQARFQQGEITITGPLFGPKIRQAAGDVVQREESVLAELGLNLDHFRRFAKHTPGARRPFWIRPSELQVEKEPDGLRMRFTLPPGVYATMLLREIQKPNGEP